jgi:hypothetical protein
MLCFHPYLLIYVYNSWERITCPILWFQEISFSWQKGWWWWLATGRVWAWFLFSVIKVCLENSFIILVFYWTFAFYYCLWYLRFYTLINVKLYIIVHICIQRMKSMGPKTWNLVYAYQNLDLHIPRLLEIKFRSENTTFYE